MAYGVLPGMVNPSTTGALIREGQRHLAGWVLQPVAELLAEEASRKLGGSVTIDVGRPLQAFDAGGRARALSQLIEAMGRAKELGLSPAEIGAAFKSVNWGGGTNSHDWKTDMPTRRAQVIQRRERRERDARRARMGEARYKALVKDLARVIRLAFQSGATGSLWGLEGPLCAAIRSDLCLQLWGWRQADKLAREALDDAFRIIGAARPSWYEGQPEWVIEAGTLIERTRCARCHKPLPEGHHKFCSRLCNTSYAARLARLRQADEDTALRMAVNLD